MEYPPGELLHKIGVISSKLQNDDTFMAQMWEEGLNSLNHLSSLQNPREGEIYTEDEDPSIVEPVLEVFRNRTYISLSLADRNDDRQIPDETRRNGETTDSNRHYKNTTDNRFYCYHCRLDITDERQFHQQVDDQDVLVCAECFGEWRRVLLSERIQMLFEVLPDVYHNSQDQPVTAGTILGYLEDRYPDDLWTGGILEQVLSVCERDGTMFQPRPGFWMWVR